MSRIDRRGYASLYGPTAGDQIRLADTDLWIEIEHDYTATGDEMVFGGGKSIRESMGQGLTTRDQGALDVVITNTVILDHWGIVRADVGIRDGRIVAIGKSGNPDIMDGVHPKLLIGPSTDVIAGEGKILTAGAIDTHVHFLSEIEMMEALATGTTTVAGGGTGPAGPHDGRGPAPWRGRGEVPRPGAGHRADRHRRPALHRRQGPAGAGGRHQRPALPDARRLPPAGSVRFRRLPR
ncbi:MAG: hypothetical protein ABS976_17985, partial [Rhodococcus sp. (in: high G+C Gram-positive bacteria)]